MDRYMLCVYSLLLVYLISEGVDGQNLDIITDPVGLQVDGLAYYPILTNVTLICVATAADGTPATATSYTFDSVNCMFTCFYKTRKITQNITGNNLQARDTGDVICSATIDDKRIVKVYRLRISGVKITGGTVGTTMMGDGTDAVRVSNILDDKSVIYLDYSEQTNGILFRCVTGYPSSDPNTIGDLYFYDILLPKGMCSGLVQVEYDGDPGVLNGRVCGSLTTSTEGVYICKLMNSSMMYQSIRVGVYFSGRTAPVITTKQSLISALDVVIGAPLTLTCTSSGSPPEIFIWMKDGVGINSTSITSIIAVNYTNTSAIFSTSYTISNLSTSDNGTYTCTVSNLIGNDCHAIAVHVSLLIEFASRQFIGSESSGYIEVTVRITGGSPSNPITVTVTPSEWSAKGSDKDFNSNSFNITIDAGATEGRANVSITCDYEIEGLETFNMTLSLANGSSEVILGRNTSSEGHIIDSSVVVSFSQPSYGVMEDDVSVTVMMLLSQSSPVPFQVMISTIDVTAKNIIDYVGGIITVNVSVGITAQSFTIDIVDNDLVDCIKRFNITIVSAMVCTVATGNDSNSEVIITDHNEEVIVVSLSQSQYTEAESNMSLTGIITLSNETSKDITVEVTLNDGSADVEIDYANSTSSSFNVTISAGSTSSSFTVDIIDDGIQEDNETFYITIGLLPSCLPLELGIAQSTVTVINTEVPPLIHTHPSDKNFTVYNDSTSITLTCMAYGASSYSWQRENGTISSYADGINTSTLLLHNVTPQDSGHYWCEAENSNGNVSSDYFIIDVKAHPPVVNIYPPMESVESGQSVQFNCSATGVGSSNFAYQWFLNREYIWSGSVFYIDAVSVNKTGNYTCYVMSPYGGIGQSEQAILILEDQSCHPVTEPYPGFIIDWNETKSGVTLDAPCDAPKLNGSVKRRCIIGGEWDEIIECYRKDTKMLLNMVEGFVSSVSESNETEKINKTAMFAGILDNITTPSQEPLFPRDINFSVNIMSFLNTVTETVVSNLTANDTFFENTTSVINNLLNETYKEEWIQLEKISPTTSQALVRDAEQVAKLLNNTLTNDSKEITKSRSNIVIKAERISPDKNYNFTSYVGGSAQLMIPNSLLQSTNYTEFTIASTVIKDGRDLRLPSPSVHNGTEIPDVLPHSIFSLQIDPPPDSATLKMYPIMMMFDVEVPPRSLNTFTLDNVSCNFYNHTLITKYNLNRIGGWSTAGLTVDKNQSNRTLVTCLARHLTSFAVLVSIEDEKPPSAAEKALSIISYFGCAISLVCLCLSIIFLSYAIYKIRNKVNHLFVHLNLCIALALGDLVFIAGIESATSNEGGCKFVAALLQYLFISAFCWMLCEGVMLYMMLVTVFENKLNKRRCFLILGWGPAIPIVAISVGIAHKHYGTNYYCWIKSDDGAIAAFIVPIVAIILVNCVFLVITLKVLLVSQHKKAIRENVASNKDTAKRLLKAMMILLPLLGLTWIIGILSVNHDTQVFAWIFAILNSLQGVFIFIFHVLRNDHVAKNVRERYHSMRNSKVFRSFYSHHGSDSTVPLGFNSKVKASQSAVSEGSCKQKFGGSSRNQSEVPEGSNNKIELAALRKLEDSIIGEHDFEEKFDKDTLDAKEKLENVIEKHDTGVEDKAMVRDNDDDNEKKSITEEDGAIILAEQNSVAAATDPVPLPCTTK